MLRRFAATICVAFLLALFLPLALPGPSAAPNRAAPMSQTESVARLAPIVVNYLLLPRTADAQVRLATDTSTPAAASVVASSYPAGFAGHSNRFWALIAALVIVAAWGAWRLSQRGDDSSYNGYSPAPPRSRSS